MTLVSKLFVSNENLVQIITAAGDPTSGFSAPQGSTYLRTDGGTASTLYVKTGTAATAWSAVSAGGVSSIAWNDVTGKPVIVSSSAQIAFTGLTAAPAGLVSSSGQVSYTGLAGLPVGIISSSVQVQFLSISNRPTLVSASSQVTYAGLSGLPVGIISSSAQVQFLSISNRPNGLLSSSAQLTGLPLTWSQTQTFSEEAVFNKGGQVLRLGPGASADHSYIGFYARSSSPTVRSAYAGFSGPTSTDFVIDNELAGTLIMRTSGSVRAQVGPAGVTSTNGTFCHTNNTVMMNIGSNFTQLYDPSGTDLARVQLGNTGDVSNYYNNTNHFFRSRNHASTFATINTNGISVEANRYNNSAGAIILGQIGGSYTTLHDASGITALQLGPSGDAVNTYRNTSHQFKSRNDVTTFATVNSSGITAVDFILTT